MPRLLDLFCGAGGAAAGYAAAGFEVVGVDLYPQPNYPWEFIQGDALAQPMDFIRGFDAIHASPPCQAYTPLRAVQSVEAQDSYRDLVPPTRELLRASGLPYVIENVPGAPLLDPIVLCGLMFGLRLFRHRLFESNLPLVAPAHVPHAGWIATPYKNGRPGSNREPFADHHVWSLTGHMGGAARAAAYFGVPWMSPAELVQFIPPAYTEFIAQQVLHHLRQDSDSLTYVTTED